MSKLDELIQELCPNGVEFPALNTICNIYDGTHQTPKYTENGIKFVSVENIENLYDSTKYISEVDYLKYKIKPFMGDVLMTRIGSIGKCAIVDRNEELAYYVSLALLRPNKGVLDSRYLKYAIESLHGRKELRKRTLVNAVPIKVNMGDIGKITIPLPPLEVQREIVSILDNFTELTAELTARKKQYEFYRNKMLTFDTKVTWRRLDEIANSFRGEYITKKSTHEGTVPVILGGQEPAYYIDKSNYEGEIVVVVRSGASVGFVSYWNEPIFVTDGFGYEGKPELIITKYLYYILKNIEGTLNTMKRGAGVPHISGEALAKIMLPVP